MASPDKHIPEISRLQRWLLRQFLGQGKEGAARALATLRNIWSLFLRNRTVEEYLKSAEAIRRHIDPNGVQAARIKALERLTLVRLATLATLGAIAALIVALLPSPAGSGSDMAIPARETAQPASSGTALDPSERKPVSGDLAADDVVEIDSQLARLTFSNDAQSPMAVSVGGTANERFTLPPGGSRTVDVEPGMNAIVISSPDSSALPAAAMFQFRAKRWYKFAYTIFK